MTLRSALRACRPRAARLALVAGLGLAVCAYKCNDPRPAECPNGPWVLRGTQLVCAVPTEPSPTPAPSPEPTPTATPSPTPVDPGPTPTPEPTATPTASPTPAPTPDCADREWIGEPTCGGCCKAGETCRINARAGGLGSYACYPVPTPTPKPTPEPCVERARQVLEYQLRQGHVTKRTETLWCNEDAAHGPDCHDPKTGDRIDPETRAVLTPGWRWWGTCEPQPSPTVTPTPVSTPTPGATPVPGPTPATCPRLVRWGLAPEPFVGTCESGACLFDTTPRFERFPGDTRGFPCNGEHDACGGRKCEDPRGLAESGVTVHGGGDWKLIDGAYKVKVNGSTPPQSIRVCPRADLRDSTGPIDPGTGLPTAGQPVRTVGDGCDSKSYR